MEDITKVELPVKRGKDLSTADQIQMFKQYYSKGYKSVWTQFGKLQQHQICNRQVVLFKPDNLAQNPSLLIHLHGSRGFCWNQALFVTRWIELAQSSNLVVAFGQAIGAQPEQAHTHHIFKGIAFGERYWEIRDVGQAKNAFLADLSYIQEIITTNRKLYNCKKIYVSGHSNGGVFGCLLSIYLAEQINGFYSSMGGIGWDPYFELDFRKLQSQKKKPRIYFVTGEKDSHLKPTQIAQDIFKNEGYATKLEILEDVGHLYQHKKEIEVLKWWQYEQ